MGEKLPSERKLAESLNVSRPILHEALVELEAKGLVEIQARRGVFISDFRRTGSTALLSSLMSFQSGRLEEEFLQSMIAFRLLFEKEIACLAARNCSQIELERLKAILFDEFTSDKDDKALLTELDFNFHLELALASGNMIYPMIVNSFKTVYTNITGDFFQHTDIEKIKQVFGFHEDLVQAIEEKDEHKAGKIMAEMLNHGALYYSKQIQ